MGVKAALALSSLGVWTNASETLFLRTNSMDVEVLKGNVACVHTKIY